jgi:CDGSH-type Zn-finger protein
MPAMSGSSSKVTITSLTDGPLQVDGEVEILASDGTVVKETSKSFLCRCGHSANKPFCDGAHKREGFSAS